MKKILLLPLIILSLSGCDYINPKTSYVCKVETGLIPKFNGVRGVQGDERTITLLIPKFSKNYQISYDDDLRELSSKYMTLSKSRSNDIENVYDYDNESDKNLKKMERHSNWLKINKISGEIEIWVNHRQEGYLNEDGTEVPYKVFDNYHYYGECRKVK